MITRTGEIYVVALTPNTGTIFWIASPNLGRFSDREERVLPDKELLFKILEGLYEAPLDPSRWEEFLRLTAQAVGAEAAAMLFYDPETAHSLVTSQWGLDPEAARGYEERYGEIDVWRQRVATSPRRLGTSEQFLPFAELRRTELYNEVHVRYGIAHAIFVGIERSPSRLVNVNVFRGLRAGPFEEQDLPLIRFLTPHIKRAYRLHSELAASRTQRASLQAALDSLAMGVFLLGPKGRVVAMNLAAQRLLAENDGLQASRDRLRAERAEESARLERFIAEATATSAGAGLEPAGALTVARRNRPALQMLVSPVRGFDVDERHPVRAIVLVSDPGQRVRPTQDTLRVLFGLTPAECRLAMLLADGHAPTGIAELLGVGRNTLKSQLASIYRKTDTSRQAQLVRLILQLPAPLSTNSGLWSRSLRSSH